MKKIILFLLITLSIHYSNAQTNQRDSLKQLLQKEKSDTSRVWLLLQLSYRYLDSKPDSAMLLALKGLELSRRIGFTKGEVVSLNGIGVAYTELGNYQKAMEAFLQALKMGSASTVNNIGNIYRFQGQYHEAIEYYLKGKQLSEQRNDKDLVAVNLGNLARSYLALKQYDSAKNVCRDGI